MNPQITQISQMVKKALATKKGQETQNKIPD